ncbi:MULTISPECIES: EthD domain-containing protein [Sphingomonas]|uniref:Ethyl tert-butyl ether degradation protein EthD n=1 Tax=Sphingomonas adhaesiva TaxID=28212 RepID=A0A2A4I732_9SPHN|nr:MULTISPECIES: EthD domain-containing protein [Sphingomonas]PCG14285.1 ethyl tert-butyl ether degradation protein EthD [Sphingomonas adhaesiva]PZU80623.1 MAG: EthD family reductase [Sphingomonas sp.]
MIKMIFCLHRLPGLSREDFQLYWRERHAPLVQEVAPILRIRRYVQSHSFTHAAIAGRKTSSLGDASGFPEPIFAGRFYERAVGPIASVTRPIGTAS